ncbi:hypothetical protein Q8W40_27115 [Vibrio penaeicida]|uniref:hypothetical protein n=1 Tax=Vibrio penaeicida TaxID=104609 RepID=UPI0027367973|nr:hypothetical protein [Vibrio penaeicida]MDP2575890.1 hypothetical protein [Vibrio penaeicida]
MKHNILYLLIFVSFFGFSRQLDNLISDSGYGSVLHLSPYHFKYSHPEVPNITIETEMKKDTLKISFSTGSYQELSEGNITRYSQSVDTRLSYKVSDEIIPDWNLSSEEQLLLYYQNQYYELIQSQYVPDENYDDLTNPVLLSEDLNIPLKAEMSKMQAMSGGRCAQQQNFLTNRGYGGFSNFDSCVASQKNALYIATLNASLKCGARPSSVSCHRAGQAQAEAAIAYTTKAESCNRSYKAAQDSLKNCKDKCYACHK